MANTKLVESVPAETGLVRIVWRLDSTGSGGINQHPIPLYIKDRYIVIAGVRGSATLSFKLYADLGDIPGAANDFPPAGLVLIETLGPFSVSSGSSTVATIPLYANFVEPMVENMSGEFVAYVVATGSL